MASAPEERWCRAFEIGRCVDRWFHWEKKRENVGVQENALGRGKVVGCVESFVKRTKGRKADIPPPSDDSTKQTLIYLCSNTTR